ncbi:uncharacterized protein ACA1_389670 [Acanthamoeba castellanii str. Neff]|uniref:Uncharacterized protein n=1 Tax=Acanthamoeba castellanii (strain ATCC 30010 / Neff) TaxID=1257118 RepID=L8GGC7_ACACF|nr:uncharacterized protein ACA1_389670 [Acanthamoeba castellanii str. Neff]ELR11246.1 hypothetical protein ACA1_389670 [Acanthamoeba castellanii str. Neff]
MVDEREDLHVRPLGRSPLSRTLWVGAEPNAKRTFQGVVFLVAAPKKKQIRTKTKTNKKKEQKTERIKKQTE